MAAETTKACETCGTEYATRRPRQARYCSFCAAANNILHFKDKQVKCMACDTLFCPATARDILCASCDHNPRFCRAVVSGTCRYCARDGVTLADAEIPVCFSCWKSPEVRQRLVKTLAKRRAERIAAHKQGDA